MWVDKFVDGKGALVQLLFIINLFLCAMDIIENRSSSSKKLVLNRGY